MRAVIYGVGQNFEKYFNNEEFIEAGIVKKGIEVTGFTDSNRDTWGSEIIYHGKQFTVKGIDEFQHGDVEKIIVSTKRNFAFIRAELLGKGYQEEQVLLIDVFFEAYLDEVFHIKNFMGKTGLEIGGPTQLFINIYEKCISCDNVNFSLHTIWGKNETNTFSDGGRVLGNIMVAEATDMRMIKDETYDFILSSNNLEHIANPLKAMEEFARVTKPEGIVLVLVPRKEKTFDHNREYTEFGHLLEDYVNHVGEDDLSHLPEIIERHDYDMDLPCGGKEKFIERAKKNMENRCLHHHVFDDSCLRKVFEFVGLEVISCARVTDNWMMIGRKHQSVGKGVKLA